MRFPIGAAGPHLPCCPCSDPYTRVPVAIVFEPERPLAEAIADPCSAFAHCTCSVDALFVAMVRAVAYVKRVPFEHLWGLP